MELGAGNLSRNFPHFCLDCVAGAGAETSALSFLSALRAFFRQTWRWFSTTSTSRLANVDELQPVFQQRRLSILLVFIELSSPQAINHNSGFRPSVTQSSHPTGTLRCPGQQSEERSACLLEAHKWFSALHVSKDGALPLSSQSTMSVFLRGFETAAGASTAGFNGEMGLSRSVLSSKLFRRPCQILVPDKEPFFSAMPSGHTISWNLFRERVSAKDGLSQRYRHRGYPIPKSTGKDSRVRLFTPLDARVLLSGGVSRCLAPNASNIRLVYDPFIRRQDPRWP